MLLRCWGGLNFVVFWYFTLVPTALFGNIEIIEEQSCDDKEFRLTCSNLDSHIAILEAWFTPTKQIIYRKQSKPRTFFNKFIRINVNEETSASEPLSVIDKSVKCNVPHFVRSYVSSRSGTVKQKELFRAKKNSSINIREPLNHRCTGVNHCSFILKQDYKYTTTWGPGAVYIKYSCYDLSRSVPYCDQEIAVSNTGDNSEGYLVTPGYPHYYVGEEECWWRLVADTEQTIRITIVDISLRSIGPFENRCMDSLSIYDGFTDDELLYRCEQNELPLIVHTRSNIVNIVVDARSKGAFPKRGVLIHYKSIGCTLLVAPSDGYMVYRDGSLVHYTCSVFYIFPDSRQRTRTLTCIDDNRWNDTLPNCIKDPSFVSSRNFSEFLFTSRFSTVMPPTSENMIVDIVIPSLLIVALFIGNAFIVLIIYKYRKRKNDDSEEEFNTIPLSNNGIGNAV